MFRIRLMRPVVALIVLLFGSTAVAEDWAGKVAIITGSSSGLGYELALIAAEKDMKLVLADIQPAPSRALAARVLAEGGEAIAVEVDLADPDARAQVVEAALEAFGTVDVLFNNAGYLYAATLEQMDLTAARHQFEVNYWAYADLAQRVIPIMKEAGGGAIVNVASAIIHRPASAGYGHYAATKQAIRGSFEAAAEELAPYGIDVFIASPGGLATNILRNSVGPLAEDSNRDAADSWEHPSVAARDIFDAMGGDDLHLHPGAVEGP
ncbi:MAG: SDR family NAD(P)-dependent oxidoreductase [Gammaproteobacteria bacterium]|nr:SDR family NAD(P)-dependent oxidoreductase [Gammaproteobacteria bacterium]